jgi:PAS domain S-box-containing protein
VSTKKKVRSRSSANALSKSGAGKKSDSIDSHKTKAQIVAELKKLRLINAKLTRAADKSKVAKSEISLLYDAIGDYITAVDTKFRILSYNKAVEDQFGKNLKGKTCYKVYQARDDVCPGCAVKRAIETKKTAFAFQQATEVSKPVEIYAYPVLDKDGEVAAVIEHGRDVSEKLDMQEKYRILFENANDAIMIADAETGIILEANKKAGDLLGRPVSEIIGMHQSEVHFEKEAEHYSRVFEEHVTREGIVPPEVLYFRHRDGHRIPVEVSPSVFNIGGRKLIQGTFRDVTERLKIENAFKDSEEMFRSIFEKSPVGIEIYDPEGWLIAANRSSLDIFGVAGIEALEGFNFFNDYYVTDKIKDRLSKDENVKYKVAFDFDEAKKRGILETAKSGLIYLDVQITPLRGMRTGISGGYLFQVQDVTERELAVEALSESEEKFRTLADKSPNMIFINMGGRVTYVNDKCVEIMGYEKEHFYSPDFSFLSLIAPEHIDLVKAKYKEHLEGNEATSYECSIINKEGMRIDAINATKLINYRGEQAILGIITDITEMKKMQKELLGYQEHLQDVVDERTAELKETAESLELEIIERKKMEEELLRAQKLESVGILAGGIAHDFNNALTAILNNIYIVKMSISKEDKSYKRLEAADAAVQRAQGLTNQLLTFSMGGDPVKKKCHIPRLLQETSDFAIRGSNVKCEFDIAGDLWPVEADEGQLSQVISNLVINADHAMPEGGTIRVSASNVHLADNEISMLEEGEYVKLSVKDRGIGIPRALLPKIFDPYFTTKQKGSGLGLATSYSIVVKHGGQIAVETGEDGTTFHVYLPALEGDAVYEEQGEMDLTVGRGNVLLMEDEALIAQSVVMGLEEFGFRAEYVPDGESAIESYRRARESGSPFDAVVLDLTIPGAMGGKEAINKLKEMDPDVKAIVASGYSNDPVMSSFREYGFISVLRKPYNIEDLAKELKKVI